MITLTLRHGGTLLVNPDFIICIEQAPQNYAKIYLEGRDFYVINESIAQVADLINCLRKP